MLPIFSPALLFWLGLLLTPAARHSNQTAPFTSAVGSSASSPVLLEQRSSPSDLEVGGELTGLASGSSRFVRYDDLLKLPMETYTVTDDANFKGATEIAGVPLAALAKLFGQSAKSNIIIAICYDKYRANYPSEYVAAHHPILVLKINGKLRDQWPVSEDGGALGPYLVSHPPFTPSFKILSHEDEAQIPFGVIRLDFRSQSEVYAPIKPGKVWANDLVLQQGYEIARQDCFRCHGLRSEGGQRASRSWLILGAWAATDPTRFQQYIRQPTSIQPCAKMPAHAEYDDATLSALTRYFSSFVSKGESE